MPEAPPVLIRIVADPTQAVAGMRATSAATSRMTAHTRIAGMSFGKSARAGGFLNAQLISMMGTMLAFTTVLKGFNKAFGTIAGFEKSMSKVKAISGATTEELKMLEDEARRLGAITTFSAQDAADGLSNLAMAGLTVKEMFVSIETVLRLAQAGSLDLGRAAEITAGIMRGFSIAATDSARVADVLAMVSASAMTNVEKMGQSMKFIAPFASALGITLEQTSAMVGTLGNNFLQAGLAGRGLAGTLGQMMKLSAKGKAKLAEFGLTAEDIRPDIVGMDKVLQNLSEAIAGDRIKGNSLLVTLFGGANFDVIMALINGFNNGTMKDLEEKLINAEGAAMEMSKTMTDNLASAVDILRATVEETFLVFGDMGLREATTGFIRNITDGVHVFREGMKSGKLSALFGLNIKLAFRRAINFAATNLLALYPLVFELGRNIVRGFTAGGLGGRLVGIATAFGDLMLALATGIGVNLLEGIMDATMPMIAGSTQMINTIQGGFEMAVGGLKIGLASAAITFIETIAFGLGKLPGIDARKVGVGAKDSARQLREEGAEQLASGAATANRSPEQVKADLERFRNDTLAKLKKDAATGADTALTTIEDGVGDGFNALKDAWNDTSKKKKPVTVIDEGKVKSELDELVGSMMEQIETTRAEIEARVNAKKAAKLAAGGMMEAAAEGMTEGFEGFAGGLAGSLAKVGGGGFTAADAAFGPGGEFGEPGVGSGLLGASGVQGAGGLKGAGGLSSDNGLFSDGSSVFDTPTPAAARLTAEFERLEVAAIKLRESQEAVQKSMARQHGDAIALGIEEVGGIPLPVETSFDPFEGL